MKLKPSAKQTIVCFVTLAAIASLFLLVSYLGEHVLSPAEANESTAKQPEKNYQRIVALAPSIVEVVYQLELDDELVGVSRFSKHPAEALKKPVVGGYIDLNFEAVVRLKPDCVILLEEQQAIAERLHQLGIDTLSVDHASTDGIIQSIHTIAENFAQVELAKSITRDMELRINQVKRKQTTPRPSVLIIIGRDTSLNAPSQVTIAGNKGVHQEYITIAGASNAYQGAIAYPVLSREKLIHLNPDIIIELTMKETWEKLGEETLRQQWQNFEELQAVKNDHIFFLHEDKHMIPGPRFVDTLEAISQIIHPHAHTQTQAHELSHE
ncbi:MAG: ABC transporter substrate-binding protein [Akkermansiaceae bacterium]